MRRRTSLTAVTLLVSCLLGPLPAAGRSFSQTDKKVDVQPGQADLIDAYITREMQARRIPGLALAVVERGKVTLKRAFISATSDGQRTSA